MRQRLRRIVRWWPAGVICLLVALPYFFASPPNMRPRIVPNPEITHAMGPLSSDGLIDYKQALNERLSQGITPEENANVLIAKVLGPFAYSQNGLSAKYYTWLGIEKLPDNGNYYLSWWKYVLENIADDRRDDFPGERFYRTVKKPWKAKDEPELVHWLQINQEPLSLLAGVVSRPKYYNPITSFHSVLRGSLIEITYALRCRSMLAIEEGRYEDAWQDLLTCRYIGYHMSQGERYYEASWGWQFINQAIHTQLVLLRHRHHSPSKLRQWLHDLQQIPPLPSFSSTIDLHERFAILDKVQTAAYGSAQSRKELAAEMRSIASYSSQAEGKATWEVLLARSADYTATFQEVNRHFDLLVKIASSDRTTRRDIIAQAPESSLSVREPIGFFEHFDCWMMGNEEFVKYFSDYLFSHFILKIEAIEKLCNHFERTQQAQQNLKIAFALAIYRAEKGRYPDKLAELVPHYLAEIPSDLFSGKALIYRPIPDGYLLYSVGPNEEDEEGKGDDLAVQMPLPEIEQHK